MCVHFNRNRALGTALVFFNCIQQPILDGPYHIIIWVVWVQIKFPTMSLLMFKMKLFQFDLKIFRFARLKLVTDVGVGLCWPTLRFFAM